MVCLCKDGDRQWKKEDETKQGRIEEEWKVERKTELEEDRKE